LILILIMLEEVGKGVGQVGSCGGSLTKESKSKLCLIKLGRRVWEICRVAIVNVGAHFINVCLWTYHPIQRIVYEVLPVNFT
jgi:hypothetical protein